MTETLRAFGKVGPFDLTLTRNSQPAGPGGYPRASLSLALVNGNDVRPVAGYAEHDVVTAGAAGDAIISAFAIAGGSVTIGGPPASPVPATGTAGPAAYTRAITLTPGTPVPPGRGVIVKGAGNFVLKLQGGGTVSLVDNTGGGGTQYDGFAVVDADLTVAGSSVQVLY